MDRAFPKFGYNPVTGEWSDSLRADYFWSSANGSEAVPDVMTPGTWSLWWIYFFEIHPRDLPGDRPICGNICGRPYVNLSMTPLLYHAVGLDASKEKFGDLPGSVPPEFDIPYLPFSPRRVIWHVLPGMLTDQHLTRRDGRPLKKYLADILNWLRSKRLRMQQCGEAASLLSLWIEQLRPANVHADRMLRSVTPSLSEPATKLNLELTALVGEGATNTRLSNLSGAGGKMEGLGPLLGLARVKDGRLTREQSVERYGHRGPHEVELYFPASADDPRRFEKRLADLNRTPVDVEALLKKQRSQFDSAWERLKTRFPDKYPTLRRKLDLMTAAAKNRERRFAPSRFAARAASVSSFCRQAM